MNLMDFLPKASVKDTSMKRALKPPLPLLSKGNRGSRPPRPLSGVPGATPVRPPVTQLLLRTSLDNWPSFSNGFLKRQHLGSLKKFTLQNWHLYVRGPGKIIVVIMKLFLIQKRTIHFRQYALFRTLTALGRFLIVLFNFYRRL